jgi:hypothetical protein
MEQGPVKFYFNEVEGACIALQVSPLFLDQMVSEHSFFFSCVFH